MTHNRSWKMTPLEVFSRSPIIPVMIIDQVDDAVPLAKALLAGGLTVLEITLRTGAALEAIKRIADEVPGAIVGAGTVTNANDLLAVEKAGGVFAISPGLTPTLLRDANQGRLALIPGISTPSELMLGMEMGYSEFKFFPAAAAGGVKMLKSIGGPFPQATFCPTGGISPENYREYLALPNVACVGGSWIVPKDAIAAGDWQQITDLARSALTFS